MSIANVALMLSLTAPAADPARSREFQFTYRTTVTGLAADQKVRVWLPIPPANSAQEAALVTKPLAETVRISREQKYGNLILYVEPKREANGTATIEATYRIKRFEVHAELDDYASAPTAAEIQADALFLKPDAKVPITGKPLTLLEGKELPADQLKLGRALYDLVNTHMRYSKEGTGWGQGDSVWACDSRYGNCSDFHSLFISLARSRKMPARFEMGFPLPDKRGAGDIAGYHCWALFKPAGKGWVPVDISEANKNPDLREYYFGNLSENRVCLSIGRDITLVPKQDGPPLNFFIHAHVEVDGKAHPEDKAQGKYAYRDLDQK